MDIFLVTVAVFCLFITAFIKICWGLLALTEGRQGRSWKAYCFDWEFSLGGTLFSSALIHLFFGLYAASAALSWFSLSTRIWVYSFIVISINLSLWCGRSGYIWYRRRYNP